MRKLWRIVAAMFAVIIGVSGVFAQRPVEKRQPYFKPKRVLLLSAANVLDNGRASTASRLSTTALQSLRNQFVFPQYRPIPEVETLEALRIAALGRLPINALVETENPTWLADRPTRDTTTALVAAGKAANADTAVFVLVKEADTRQVTLVLWHIDVATGHATVEGKKISRNADYYMRTQRAGWDTYASVGETPGDISNVKASPETDGRTSSISVNQPDLDDSMRRILISRMLTEWSTRLYK